MKATDRANPERPGPFLDEDVPSVAALAYGLADIHCGHCRNYHAMWPYHRLAIGAGQGGLSTVERALARRIAAGATRILIAGAADTGVLATVARAAAGRKIAVAVVDRCATPIELCRRFAERWSLEVEGTVADVANLNGGEFDLVYASSLLSFVPAGRHAATIAGIRRALKPGGHLVYAFTTSTRIAENELGRFRDEHVANVLEGLHRKAIPLPESMENFSSRLRDYAGELRSRDGIFESPETVEALIRNAGFIIQAREQVSGSRQYFRSLAKQRFLLSAQSQPD